MAKKTLKRESELPAAEPQLMPITKTIEDNYMPYMMSVILSRAIPEIDGFKPSHRKLLYTMYKMGLMGSTRTKSANVVGATMKLNPHGDMAIYETMVRLARGNESLLHPFVDSKGNFGKVYSRDMAFAAPRYTEVKLDPICAEIFKDIDSDTVDFVDNYDSTMQEPTLLPTTFPNILVSPNLGIAVGMASKICSFNLAEICEATIEYLKDPEVDLLGILKAPDFPTGGELIYDRDAMDSIYRTGLGSFRVRAVWNYDPKQGCIEITEIPYTTTVEAIMDKVSELVKEGRIREISDMRDETDKQGLKLTIDLKRGADPDKLMQKLMKTTTLCDSFGCNFNILIAGTPKVMGVGEILSEWTAWRVGCVKRKIFYELGKMKDRLHLLQGLKKILLDIDRAIAIIRNTEDDADVIPNLMIGFGIDEIQANFIAEIKLRNINKEYILKRISETDELESSIAEYEDILKSRRKIERIIIDELTAIKKKYGAPRRTKIVYEAEELAEEIEETVEDYQVHYFVTADGYFKKVTPQSLRMSGEHKLKEGDRIAQVIEGSNADTLLFFTDRQQVYKIASNELEETKVSMLGSYIPQKLGFEEGESFSFMAVASKGKYEGWLMFFFANGKCARVPMSAYETKTNRKRLIAAYSDKSPLASAVHITSECELAVFSDTGRAVVFNSAAIAPKTTKNTAGVGVMTLKGKAKLSGAKLASESGITNFSRYRTRNVPAAGALLKPEDSGETQIVLE
ncbi:MAG: topoisomerase IV [Clostridia bacterium]|nr:topoisomerase IV [Clostridia bacterium]